MGDWKEYKLGDLVEIKSGKRLPKGELLVDYDTGHPYIRVTDLGHKWVKKQDYNLSQKKCKNQYLDILLMPEI